MNILENRLKMLMVCSEGWSEENPWSSSSVLRCIQRGILCTKSQLDIEALAAFFSSIASRQGNLTWLRRVFFARMMLFQPKQKIEDYTVCSYATTNLFPSKSHFAVTAPPMIFLCFLINVTPATRSQRRAVKVLKWIPLLPDTHAFTSKWARVLQWIYIYASLRQKIVPRMHLPNRWNFCPFLIL